MRHVRGAALSQRSEADGTHSPPPDPTQALKPLTLEQKHDAKRFNKTLDRIAASMIAVGVGVIAYGCVQEILSPRGAAGVRWISVAWSGLVGGALVALGLAGGYIWHRRED